MAWRDVMVAVMPLVDLYGTKRVPGEGAMVPFNTTPSRASDVDDPTAGLFFAVGTSLLELLDAGEEEAPGTYTLIAEILTELRKDFPECVDEDFLFVIQKLSARYNMYFVRDGVLLKDTALIDQAKAGKRIRLSAKGRMALVLSETSEDWAYLDLDAEKLLRSISRGNFREVEKFSTGMLQKIKDASLQIRRILELPTVELKAQALVTENSLYLETVSKIQRLVNDALELLRVQGLQDKFDKWFELHPDDEGLDEGIRTQLLQALSMIETISRNLADIIVAVQRGARTGVRTPNFNAAALKIVLQSSYEVAEAVLKAFVYPAKTLASISDVLKPVKVSVPRSRETAQFDTVGQMPVTRLFRAFLLRHGQEFMARLSRGALSITELVRDGALGASDIEGLGELVGAFLDARSMGFGKGRFIVVPGGDDIVCEIDGRMTAMQGLLLTYQPRGTDHVY